jgi:hypothetical protein
MFSNVTENGGVGTPSFAYDGTYPGAGQNWQTNTAWWTGTDKSIVFQFDNVRGGWAK